MTFRKAFVLIAILISLAVTALVLRGPICDLFQAGPATIAPAAATVPEPPHEKAGDRVDQGIQQGRMSDHPARYWDAVGEGK